MTAPIPKPNRCEQADCSEEAATIDFVNGFRCADHPPRWRSSYAHTCRAAGQHERADAYRRAMIAFLRARIAAREAS